MKRLILCLALCSAGVAHASDWYVLNTNAYGFLLADKESLVRTGANAKMWVIESPRQTRSAPYVYAQQLMIFDCTQKTYFIKQREIFREDLVGVGDTPMPKLQEPYPDSKEQLFLKFACNPTDGLATKVTNVQQTLKERAENRKRGRFDSN